MRIPDPGAMIARASAAVAWLSGLASAASKRDYVVKVQHRNEMHAGRAGPGDHRPFAHLVLL